MTLNVLCVYLMVQVQIQMMRKNVQGPLLNRYQSQVICKADNVPKSECHGDSITLAFPLCFETFGFDLP